MGFEFEKMFMGGPDPLGSHNFPWPTDAPTINFTNLNNNKIKNYYMYI